MEANGIGMTFNKLKEKKKLNQEFYIQENFPSKLNITQQFQKRIKLLIHGIAWVNLQWIKLSEESQCQKITYFVTVYNTVKIKIIEVETKLTAVRG